MAPRSRAAAAIGTDFIGLKPKMLVEDGEAVSLGQPLFADKRFDDVVITAPAGGTRAGDQSRPAPYSRIGGDRDRRERRTLCRSAVTARRRSPSFPPRR